MQLLIRYVMFEDHTLKIKEEFQGGGLHDITWQNFLEGSFLSDSFLDQNNNDDDLHQRQCYQMRYHLVVPM